jgi:hypothetical protein
LVVARQKLAQPMEGWHQRIEEMEFLVRKLKATLGYEA